MKLLNLALSFGYASAAALVAPEVGTASDVRIVSISAIGSGCPAGHAFATVDSTGTIFDVAFDQYVVEVGEGTSAANARKNCRVSLSIEFPQGMQ
jgi:hypothetical protein